MQVAGSSQACALGAAVSAAVLAGAHRGFPAAQRAMTRVRPERYRPIAANRRVYDRLYQLYRRVHDAFGGVERSADLASVMKDLLAIKRAARA
jgi:L-ribulokinase